MKKRSDIQEIYKWDLSHFFKDDEAWEDSFEIYSKKLLEIEKFDGKLKNKKNILNCLKLIEELDNMVDSLYVYARCLNDLDVTNAKNQKLINKIESILTEQSVKSSFITPQLSKLPEKFLNKLLVDKDFKNYYKLIKDILREKEHILSEEGEKLLSGVTSFSRDFDTNFSNFEDGDLKFKNVVDKNKKSLPMNQSLYLVYMQSNDEILRENAFKTLHLAYGDFNNFLSSNYLGSVKKDVFFAKNRKFSSTLESSLYYSEIPNEVYKKLLLFVEKNISLDQSYFKLKQKYLNLKTFKISDIYYNKSASKKNYSFEEAFDIVCDALKILGEDYIDGLKRMKNDRKIDVFPTENKTSGAYKISAYGKSPLVLLNFMGEFDDVSAIAHELGHAMHSVYSDKSQSIYSASYTTFIAEIASTVNETLLNNYMLSKTDKRDEKIYFINEFISRFHSAVFRQTMFSEFEDIIHKKVEGNEPISSEILNNTYLDLVKKYFGKKVKIFDCVKYEWSRIPHYFRAFYVFKYATGLISAINIVENLKNNVISVEDYKTFLSAGCSLDPISILKLVKVDLTTDEPFITAFKVLQRYLKELSDAINKK